MGFFGKIFAIYLISNFFLCIQSEDVVLNCLFRELHSGYTCDINFIHVTEQSNVIGIRGNHVAGKGNDDVLRVDINLSNTLLHNLPQILFNEFRNLRDFSTSSLVNLSNIEPLRNCSSLTLLRLWVVSFQTLRNSTFEECRNLDRFEVFRTQISLIEPDAFRGLSKLTRLSLNEGNLRNLAGRIFKPLQSLTELILHKNQLERLNDETFVHLNQLQFLSLAENQISQIEPNAFQGLTKLTVLSLALNNLKNLDGSFLKPLHNLVELNLVGNQLERLDDDTFVHPSKLRSLTLWSNQISHMGRNFLDHFENLNNLGLKNNLCVNQDFSDVMGNIDFVRRQLEPCFPEIPANNINCRFLVTTEGYLCLVDNFNYEFDTFVAGENHVPGKTNSDVKIVRFTNSKLQSIPEIIFTDFQNVRDLDLSGARVLSYPEIQNCGNLSKLVLSSNAFTDIPNGLFRNCANLNTIDLSRNLIARIPCGLFLQNPKLQTIDFSFNRITAIEPCFMEDLRSLSEIRLLGNLCVFENFFIRNQEDLDMIENRLSQCFKNWN